MNTAGRWCWGADTPWWSGHTSIITTGLHLRSHSFHTAYIHTNNTFCGHSWLVAYYLNTSLLKSLTILVQIFVENRLDIQAWPRSCYRNAINFVVTRCCECLVAVGSGHLTSAAARLPISCPFTESSAARVAAAPPDYRLKQSDTGTKNICLIIRVYIGFLSHRWLGRTVRVWL